MDIMQGSSRSPNDPVPVPGPSPPKRNRLGADGVAILEAYWSTNSNQLQLPPLSHRKELTRAIMDLPGCSHWNQIKTADWFKRRMKKLQPGSTSSKTPQPVSPSKDALLHLSVLMKSQPNPSPDVIRTWATLLARDRGPVAVEFWTGYITHAILDREVSSQSPDCTHPPSPNLPTPAGTVTPEPRGLVPLSLQASNPARPPKMKRDPADSPTIASLTIRTQPTVAAPPSLPTPKIESPVSPFLRARQTQLRDTSLHAIIEDAVHESQHPIQRGPLPNDADEFLAMFAPYEVKLTKLLHILEQ